MQLLVFTVYDKAVGAFLPPFYVRSKGEALRSFTEACNDRSHQFFKHSSDYTLMWCGEFDDQSGLFSVTDPSRVISAFEVVMDDPFAESARVHSVNGGADEATVFTKR